MKTILSFALSLSALSFSQVLATDNDWPVFGGPNRNFQLQKSIELNPNAPTKRWQRTLGQGMSGVVVMNNTVYTSYLVPCNDSEKKKSESERSHREAIIALDAQDGKVRWRHEYDAGWIESQQAFGGRSRAPQATPAICGDHVVSIGFTGLIHCVDRTSGKLVWKKDCVEEFEAMPVQFGFAASPLPLGDRVVVLVGGATGGLVCLDVRTGDTIWNVPCNEASYATPVLWNRTDDEQIVFMTRNRIVGVSVDLGKQLWDYQLPGQGLTNVPTPLPLDDIGLLISGQGIKGTRRLNVEKLTTGYEVTEKWRSNEQFFYCNWVQRDGVLLACDGSLLMAIDVGSGKTLGRFRGYKDANLLLAGEQLLTFDGEGHLSEIHLKDSKMQVMAKYSVLDERCWTPVSPSGNYLYCRGGDQLLCLDLVGGDARAAVAATRIGKSLLLLSSSEGVVEDVGPVDKILASYQNDGAELAWKVYNQLRSEDPDAISLEARQRLAEMAQAEGLQDFAKTILQHVGEDFPEAKSLTVRTPSAETTRGDNGLVYVEFLIRNPGWQTIQAFVKGPGEHPFSYGLPLRPKQVRLEKWPVGTRLFRTQNGIRKDLLLTVEEQFAGKTISVPNNPAGKQ